MHSIKQLHLKKKRSQINDLNVHLMKFKKKKTQRSKLKPTKSEEWKLWWLLPSSSFLFLSCQNQNEWFYGMNTLDDSTVKMGDITDESWGEVYFYRWSSRRWSLTFMLLLPGWLPLMNESTFFRARVLLNECIFNLPLIDGEFLLSSTLLVCRLVPM